MSQKELIQSIHEVRAMMPAIENPTSNTIDNVLDPIDANKDPDRVISSVQRTLDAYDTSQRSMVHVKDVVCIGTDGFGASSYNMMTLEWDYMPETQVQLFDSGSIFLVVSLGVRNANAMEIDFDRFTTGCNQILGTLAVIRAAGH